jgi:hypothetical protein
MQRNQNRDDPSSAPESGTDRNETTGNQPAAPNKRQGGRASRKGSSTEGKTRGAKQGAMGKPADDASTAGEEP